MKTKVKDYETLLLAAGRQVERNLNHAVVSYCDMSGAKLCLHALSLNADGAWASNAVFDRSYLRDALFTSAHMRRASFRHCYLMDAQFDHTDLREADFSHAILEDASIHGANLQGAILHNADLSGADLRNADLRGANLDGIRLDGALLDGARGPFAAIQFSRHQLIVAGGNVHINGYRYSYTEWLAQGERIMREMQYSEPEVDLYMSASRSAIAWLTGTWEPSADDGFPV